MGSEQPSNKGIARIKLLAELIREHFEKEGNPDFVVFQLKEIEKHGIIEFDQLEKTLERMREDLKPDFDFKFIESPSPSSVLDTEPRFVIQGVKVSVDDIDKLKEYGQLPYAGTLRFDFDKSRFYVRGIEIKIQKFTDQYHTLRAIFKNPKEIGQEWFFSDIAERADNPGADDKKYYNAIHQIGLKLKAAGFPDFFITTRQSAKINAKYLS